MIPFSLLLLACLLYVLVLFAVAFWVEKRPEAPFLRSPLIYTLSLSIYCTAWTFFGAVGYAARSGLEFLTIYLGPSLVFMGWPLLLRKMLQIGQRQQITSIADMIAARFGKSNTLGVLVTLLSVAAATPYIALQLQSVTLSFQVLAATPGAGGAPLYDPAVIALWVAVGLALFTILFGTRKLDLRERHAGIVMAIALEAVVKLVALIAVGLYALWGPGAGLAASLSAIAESGLAAPPADPARWLGLIILSGAAVLCLPRMFHVTVVEATDTRHLHTAAWAFPAYLFAMSLFVLPIAVTGLRLLPAGSNPDLFVLSLPLAGGQDGLALLAFLGGFSAATSMVIVATMALATMVSNHIVVPLWLRLGPRAFLAGDVRHVVLAARRLSICVILALGYAYFLRSGGSAALAAIGLTAFAGVAQILPALVGGLFWRGATRFGAVLGLGVGSAVWVYCLLLPTLAQGLLPESFFALGPFGLSWARPEALFGVTALDPLTHAVFWSLTLNSAAFGLGSLLTFPGPVERAQGAAFVNVFEGGSEGLRGWSEGEAEPEALLRLAQRILGEEEALAFFEARARAQGKAGFLPDGTPAFLDALEVRLAGSVGAATAHAMLAQATGRAAVTVEDLLAVASEAQQMLEYSAALEAQQEALGRSARALAEANDKLTQLSEQKDNFLSQISHELRTPMTSIRAFSEMLRESDLPAEQQGRYAGIIHEEAIRLTGLLDDLLDLSVLERGAVRLSPAQVSLADVIDRALAATEALSAGRAMAVQRERAHEAVTLQTDPDRLTQVLINLIRNAQKYCDALLPELRFTVRQKGGQITLDIADNGGGIPQAAQGLIFEKFARLREGDRAGGAGLGLAICKEIMGNLGGSIRYLPGQGGAAFRLVLPLRLPQKPGRAARRAAAGAGAG